MIEHISRKYFTLLFIAVLQLSSGGAVLLAENANGPQVDLRELNNQEIYKAGMTITAMDRINKIKREQVKGIKRGPVTEFMKAIYQDGRLDSFMGVLHHLIEFDGDSCTVCWSVFSKMAMVGKEIQGKTKRTKGGKIVQKSDSKNKKFEIPPPSRELGVIVPSRFVNLVTSIRDPREVKYVNEAFKILIDELSQKRGRTPGEVSYLAQLGDMIYSTIAGDEAYQDEEAAYRNLEETL